VTALNTHTHTHTYTHTRARGSEWIEVADRHVRLQPVF